MDYVFLCRKVLQEGTLTAGRNGMTLRCFGYQSTYDRFPLTDAKKVPWRKAIGEGLWKISGSTLASDLHKAEFGASKFWDENARQFGSDDLGPTYGHQLTSWQSSLNQLEDVLGRAVSSPTSRDLIVTLYNPLDNKKSALPPCVMTYQFWVDQNQTSLMVTQRSADLLLGLPSNLVQDWSFLEMFTICLSNRTQAKYVPKKMVRNLGDYHVYEEHIETVKKMCDDYLVQCVPDLQVENRGQTSFSDFILDDFTVTGYPDNLPTFTGKVK